MIDRRTFLFQTLSLGLLASGCSTLDSHSNASANSAPNSVAVLGVVQQNGLNIPINEIRLAGQLETILREQHQYAVMPFSQVRISLGKDQHETLLRRVANFGTLEADDLRMLNRSELPTRMGLVVTITGDDVEKLDKERVQIRDSGGKLLKDRDHVILSTARTVTLSATLVNLGLGRVRMHNDFTYESVERRRYLEYNGSSFTGTVAARLANTVANGVRTPDWPEPPGLQDSFYALLEDVAEELPIR